MNVYVKFHNTTDIRLKDVANTETKDGYFVCEDDDGDNLFVTAEHNILYVQYDYE